MQSSGLLKPRIIDVQSVSPVRVSLRPIAAAMSPVVISAEEIKKIQA